MRRFAVSLSAVLSLALAGCRTETAGTDGAGPVVVISVDTLRADHLPVYGAAGIETPALDALAADSIVFENAYSQVPLTLPSHASMLTGRLPASIGVRNNLGYRFDPSVPSIPTLLGSRGFATAAFVSAWVLRGESGLGGAFDVYDDRFESRPGAIAGEIQRDGESTVAAAIDWIRGRSDDRFFLLVHLFEPHAPYEPPEPFRSRYATAPYDGEIAAADAAVGRLLGNLRDAGLYDDATIVFMSDHGEGLGDHGEAEHGIFLYREAIRVPLFLKLPRREMAGTRAGAPAALIDVFPTIISRAGIDPGEVPGVELERIALGEVPDRRIFSETMYPRIHLGWSDLASLVDRSHHYIEAPRPELYDLAEDPGETKDVLADQRRIYASMRREMSGYDRSLAPPGAVSPEEAAKLSALGYLGGPSASAGGELPDPKDRIGDLERFGEAGSLVRAGNPADAIPILERVVEASPAFADAWTLLAKAYEGSGRTEEAIEAYRRTIEVAPMLAPGTALSMAEALLELGRFDEALAHADLALEAHPGPARLARAKALLGRRDAEAAELEIRQILDDPSLQLDGLVLLAELRAGQKRLDEALSLVDSVEIRRAGREVPNLWLVRGDVLARLGRVAEAKQAFRRETAAFPKNREAWVRLGALLLLEGDAAAAESAMQAMLRENPGPSSRAMVAGAYRSLGRPDLARRWE
ncbi:MAG TPA: sulfatase-like hydrolase/transferase [Thermoanaerobaculia bacterium]|nr:sulfatase-like hydrolase/transferase [Thermoanaerobaculia bacterium]